MSLSAGTYGRFLIRKRSVFFLTRITRLSIFQQMDVKSEEEKSPEKLPPETEEGADDAKQNGKENASSSGKYPVQVFIILFMEVLVIYSWYGMKVVLHDYLELERGFNKNVATAIYHAFALVSYFLTLAGGILADSYWGRYKTIVLSGILYIIGHLILSASDFPGLNNFARTLTIVGLVVISLAAGGVKANVSSLGAEQFKLPEQQRHLDKFFSVFYFTVNFGAIIAQTSAPLLKSKIHCFGATTCYAAALGVAALFAIFTLIVFLAGTPLYIRVPCSENIFWKFVKCVFATDPWLPTSETSGYVLVNTLNEKVPIFVPIGDAMNQLELPPRGVLRIDELEAGKPYPLSTSPGGPAFVTHAGIGGQCQTAVVQGSAGNPTVTPIPGPDLVERAAKYCDVRVISPNAEAAKVELISGGKPEFTLEVPAGSIASPYLNGVPIERYDVKINGNNAGARRFDMGSVSSILLNPDMAPPTMKSVMAGIWLSTTGIGNLITSLIAATSAFAILWWEMLFYTILMLIVLVVFVAIAHFYVYYKYRAQKIEADENVDGNMSNNPVRRFSEGAASTLIGASSIIQLYRREAVTMLKAFTKHQVLCAFNLPKYDASSRILGARSGLKLYGNSVCALLCTRGESVEKLLSACSCYYHVLVFPRYPQYADIEIQGARPDQLRPKPDPEKLLFGKHFTDHMLSVEYSKELNGWGRPRITPVAPLQIHPGAKVLHYATELFEGMKAYRGIDHKIRIFRPDKNMARMNATAKRAGLPTFDGVELINCIRKLIKVDQEWVPHSDSSALYIRPTLIGTEPTLGVTKSSSALLYVLLCPVGPYFSTGLRANLLADPKFVRSWPGGCGDKKMGSNYDSGRTYLYEVLLFKCFISEKIRGIFSAFQYSTEETQAGESKTAVACFMPTLGVTKSSSALLYVLLCPVGPYFSTGLRANLLADPKFVRSWPGGCGDKKMGSNYAPTIDIQRQAEEQGFQQVLWLFGPDHQITEVGAMNLFIVLKGKDGQVELVTAPLNGLILPGVVRDSILTLAREWGRFKVSERIITMPLQQYWIKEYNFLTMTQLLEIFGSGTAAIVCPVETIKYEEHLIRVEPRENSLSSQFRTALNDIQTGRVDHPWAWHLNVDTERDHAVQWRGDLEQAEPQRPTQLLEQDKTVRNQRRLTPEKKACVLLDFRRRREIATYLGGLTSRKRPVGVDMQQRKKERKELEVQVAVSSF
ncbi:unnamed protein product [Notodromas monacha]|uniref:Branched-chain-amino-acid aminotransferase n=1 Tax=Notodromas monacha TaxID=399045 RepID=A0A7R9BQN4_9CRUS|nr:unnamed protein product [Notodromas monacha]CAG0918544.1 unnamed protein product [Notodromas monacha]